MDATLLRRWYDDVWNRWGMDPVSELATDDVTWKTAFRPSPDQGPDTLWAHMGQLKAAIPDLRAELETLEGLPHVRWRGRHTGHLWGVEGTDRLIDARSPIEVEVRAGKLARVVETLDWTLVRAQIGAPAPTVIEVPMCRVIPAFRTADWDVSRRYYVGTLGFRVLFEWRHGVDFPCFAGIERNGAVIHLSEHGSGPISPSDITIMVDDVNALYDDVTARGLVADPPVAQPWGNTDLLIQDIDGHSITFSQPSTVGAQS